MRQGREPQGMPWTVWGVIQWSPGPPDGLEPQPDKFAPCCPAACQLSWPHPGLYLHGDGVSITMNHLCYLNKPHSHPFLGSLPFLDSVIVNLPTSQHHCCPVLPHIPTWKSQTCTRFHRPWPQSSSALWLVAFPCTFQTSVPHLPSIT